MARISEIYKTMDKTQKAKAEPNPNFPQPPPLIPPTPENFSSQMIQTLTPSPPPPPSAALSAEQRQAYMKAVNETKAGQTYLQKHK